MHFCVCNICSIFFGINLLLYDLIINLKKNRAFVNEGGNYYYIDYIHINQRKNSSKWIFTRMVTVRAIKTVKFSGHPVPF